MSFLQQYFDDKFFSIPEVREIYKGLSDNLKIFLQSETTDQSREYIQCEYETLNSLLLSDEIVSESTTDFGVVMLEQWLQYKEYKLNTKEKMILLQHFKNCMNHTRQSRKVLLVLRREFDEEHLNIISTFEQELQKEITSICRAVLNTVEMLLKNVSVSDYSEVIFCRKLQADHLRYMLEVDPGNADLLTKCENSYEEAWTLCQNLSACHHTYLSVGLNYGVFMFEIKRTKEQAVTFLAKLASESETALKSNAGTKMLREEYHTSKNILQLVHKNIELWKDSILDDNRLESQKIQVIHTDG